MRNINKTVVAFFALVVFACENAAPEGHCDFQPLTEEFTLLGKWQAYEYGYSPGAGYIIDQIPVTPPQTIEFKANHVFETNFLGDYAYYYLLVDPGTDMLVAAFFKEEQNVDALDLQSLETSYFVSACTNGNISLSYRYCIEGCHYGFMRIE